MGGPLLLTLLLGLGVLAAPEALARGAKGGHGRSRGGHAPRISAAHRTMKAPSYKPPKMAHSAAPARSSAKRSQAKNPSAKVHTNTAASAGARRTAAPGTHSQASTGTQTSPYQYTYGSGSSARRYNAHGYGRGYRNRYSGGRRGYGRSQGNNRAIVSRLRSVHASLARLDRDYQGHRVRSMHAISMAVRQLSHRSMVYRGTGFGQGRNNGMAMGMRQGRRGTGEPRGRADASARG